MKSTQHDWAALLQQFMESTDIVALIGEYDRKIALEMSDPFAILSGFKFHDFGARGQPWPFMVSIGGDEK